MSKPASFIEKEKSTTFCSHETVVIGKSDVCNCSITAVGVLLLMCANYAQDPFIKVIKGS